MSYLAPPVADPINIDAGIQYKYCIPQQGYSSITVDANADFDVQMYFGSPAMLVFTYTTTVVGSPASASLVLRLHAGTSTTTQTLNFTVALSADPRAIPNITTGRS